MNAEDFNKIEWNKIFMAIAMALVFIFQAVDQMQHNMTKEVQKEHEEVQRKHSKEIEKTLTKAEILLLIKESTK